MTRDRLTLMWALIIVFLVVATAGIVSLFSGVSVY